jgi:tetratricopeptide (TPR) repeat protein
MPPGRFFVTPPDPEPLHEDDPASIGLYRLRSRLGEGGMGIVYLAERADGQPVALKVIREPFASDRRFRERFREEIRAMRRVARPYTARVLDDNPDYDPPYLVTEYVEGPTLQYAIDHGGPWPYGHVKDLAMATAYALHQVHAVGVVHRDYKPSNVLLALTSPKVIDFGIAAAADFAFGPASRLGFGTKEYMAPEQLLGEEGARPADVFAWAATLVFAATGRPPTWHGGDRKLHDRVPLGRPDLSDVDSRLRTLLERALLTDPMDRPTVPELLEKLGVTTQEPGGGQQTVEQQLARHWTRTQPPGETVVDRDSSARLATIDHAEPADEGPATLSSTAGIAGWLRAGKGASSSSFYVLAAGAALLAALLAGRYALPVVGLAVAAWIWLAHRGDVRRWRDEYRASAPYYRAVRLYHDGHHEEAERRLWDIAYHDDDVWKRVAAITLGNLYQDEAHYTKAVIAYQVGLEFAEGAMKPGERAMATLAALNLGHAYQAAQRRPEAQEAYRQARVLGGRNPRGVTRRYVEQATAALRELIERSDLYSRSHGRRPVPSPQYPARRPYRPAAFGLVVAIVWATIPLAGWFDALDNGVSFLLRWPIAPATMLLGVAALLLLLGARRDLQRLTLAATGADRVRRAFWPMAIGAAAFATAPVIALLNGS